MLVHLALLCHLAFTLVLLSSPTMSSLIAKEQINTSINPIVGLSRNERSIPWYASLLAEKELNLNTNHIAVLSVLTGF